MDILLPALLVISIPVAAFVAIGLAMGARRDVRKATRSWHDRVSRLEARVRELEEGEAKPPPAPKPEAAPRPAPQTPAPAAKPAPPPPAPKPKPAPAAPGVSLEERIGGRWFNWVGILAILFGVAYFLKYSFDRGWVTPAMRFRGGLAFGAAMLAAGVFSERRKYAVLARGFWGGGIGVFFLVLFAGHKLLLDPAGAPIIGRTTAFLGMAATVVAGIAISIRFDARTPAVFAAVGGYLTPVLLRSGSADQVFLFTYLLILTAGLLLLGYWKGWGFLRLLSFGVVVLYFAGWWLAEGPGEPWAMLLYPSALFLFFTAEIVAWSAFRRVADAGLSYFLLGLNATLHVLSGLNVLGAFHPAYQGLFLAGTSAYLLAGAVLLARRHPADRTLRLCLAYGAGLLFVAAPYFEERLADHWLSIAWSVQGALLFLCAERWGGGGHTRAFGYAALALAAGRLLAHDTPRTLAHVEPYAPFWSARTYTFGVAIAAFAYACRRARERHAGTLLRIVTLSLPAVLLSLELAQALDTYSAPHFERARAYSHQSSHWMTLLWAGYATLVATVSHRRGAGALRNVALGFGAFILVKYAVRDLFGTYVAQQTPVANSRFVVTAALAACLFWLGREFARQRARAQTLAHLLLLLGLGMEWVDLCHARGIEAGPWTGAPLLGVTLLMAGYGAAVWRFRPGLAEFLAAAAGVKLLMLDLFVYDYPAPELLLQMRFLAAAGAAAGCFLGRWPLRLLGHVVILAALGTETVDLFTRTGWSAVYHGGYAVIAIAALYGLGALLQGHRRQRPDLRGFGLAVIGLALVAAVVALGSADRAAHVLRNTRAIGLAATAAALLAGAERYRRADLRVDPPLRYGRVTESAALAAPLALCGHGLLMLLLTLESADYFRRAGAFGGDWIDSASARQLSYSLLWAVYAIGMVIGGLLRRYRPVRLMALVVLIGTILKVFLFDLSFLENPYRILSFLVLGGILVAVSFLYQKYRDVLG